MELIHAFEPPPLDKENPIWNVFIPDGATFINGVGILEPLWQRPRHRTKLGDFLYGCKEHPTCFQLDCEGCKAARGEREALYNLNYMDHLFDRLGFPELKGSRPELYFSPEEEDWAASTAEKWRETGLFSVYWSAARTAYHKIYPYWYLVAEAFNKRHTDTLVFHCGPTEAAATMVAGERIIPITTEWSARQCMALLPHFDLVVGCETGFLNIASVWDVPKIILHSHSNHEKLCKHWTNHTCLMPEGIQCAPCHQMHEPTYFERSCPMANVKIPKPETNRDLPICVAMGIKPQRVLDTMEFWYESRKTHTGRTSRPN